MKECQHQTDSRLATQQRERQSLRTIYRCKIHRKQKRKKGGNKCREKKRRIRQRQKYRSSSIQFQLKFLKSVFIPLSSSYSDHRQNPLTLQTSEQQSAPEVHGSSRNKHAFEGSIEFTGGSGKHCSGFHTQRLFSTMEHDNSSVTPQQRPAHGRNPASAVKQQYVVGGLIGFAH